MPRGNKDPELKPAWWIAYGVACGLAAAGLVLLLVSPRRGQAIKLNPAPTAALTVTSIAAVLTETSIASPVAGLRVNINTASAVELDLLPGIGPTLAQSIVAYREANGPFEIIEELQNVPDIGPATFQSVLPFITLGD
jgi:competence ComEA-like helix-hairpin-helix protein